MDLHKKYTEIAQSNIIDNDDFLNEALDFYQGMDRTIGGFNGSGRNSKMYNFLVNMDNTSKVDTTTINQKEYENFYIKMTNRWINRILTLSDEDLSKLERQGLTHYKDIKKLLSTKYKSVNSLDEIEKLYNEMCEFIDIMDLEKNNYFWRHLQGSFGFTKQADYASTFNHINSRYINARQTESESIDFRLYVNCANKNMFELIDLYINYCEKNNLPYYFKFQTRKDRKDKFLIYTSKKNLKNNIVILEQIAKEHPEIVNNCGESLKLTGSIDNWIGIACEPQRGVSKYQQSFNTLRSEILEDAAEELTISGVRHFFNHNINLEGNNVSFNEVLIDKTIDVILDDMKNNKDILDSQLNSTQYRNYLRNVLLTKAPNGSVTLLLGFKKLWEVMPKKGELISSNSKPIFQIEMPNSNTYDFNIYTADKVLKQMLPIIRQIVPDFTNRYRNKIKEKCPNYGVDANAFSLNFGTDDTFKELDNMETNLDLSTDNKQINSMQRGGNWNEINAAYVQGVLSMFSPESLNFKLIDGMSFMQYAVEVVPDNMDNNFNYVTEQGNKIPVTIFIQQIINEHQQDIVKESKKGNTR